MATMDKEEFERENMFGTGAPNDGFARYFAGQSYLNPLVDAQAAGISVVNVTFEPGCRNNWHVHRAASGGGQILLCTAGEGWYQQKGEPARSLTPGTTVMIPANVKHWHGAKAGSWFGHIAIEVPGEGRSNEWLEPVTDEEYAALA
ncbi:cupin domain-containing protein [Arabiibacter massiliensis]|uniref:cupin domain-containing protein n=1 Tax=Arabiibacter massiliensis TaxID=1870985 RepID=UPI0009BC617F|nr:cupin domain-containing protein [Arabiibacter massiliensis]